MAPTWFWLGPFPPVTVDKLLGLSETPCRGQRYKSGCRHRSGTCPRLPWPGSFLSPHLQDGEKSAPGTFTVIPSHSWGETGPGIQEFSLSLVFRISTKMFLDMSLFFIFSCFGFTQLLKSGCLCLFINLGAFTQYFSGLTSCPFPS